MLLALLLAATLTVDFPAIHIGIAEYEAGPTGCTVFYFPKPVMVAVDVRGGSPGTINTDTLRLSYDSPYVDAITFSKPNAFETGARGAGRFAMQGGYFGDAARTYSGQGAAFRQAGNVKVAVFTVVNSLGAIVDRNGNIVRCTALPCGTIADRLSATAGRITRAAETQPTENTTLTLVVTNQKLPVWALQRLAVQVHTSMARAIQPFHTTRDGDVLFAATTGEVENAGLSVADLGVVASETAWDAVLSSVPAHDPADTRPVIDLPASALDRLTGRYEFAPGVIATVTREGARLHIEASKGSRYLPEKQRVALDAVSPAEFRYGTMRIAFDERGLTINPGHWPVRGLR